MPIGPSQPRGGAKPLVTGEDILAVQVAINGFGRIGRNVLRALVESGRTDIEVVGITDLGSAHRLFTEEPGDARRRVPVLFGAQAGFGTFKAAGIVASWLGAQSKSRKLVSR